MFRQKKKEKEQRVSFLCSTGCRKKTSRIPFPIGNSEAAAASIVKWGDNRGPDHLVAFHDRLPGDSVSSYRGPRGIPIDKSAR